MGARHGHRQDRAAIANCSFDALKVGLPWVAAEMSATEQLMGPDYWPYGVEANLKTLQTCARYVFEQAITPRQVEIEEMFAPTTLKTTRI